MAASSADAPTNPDAVIRASDSERDDAIDELRERFAEGRLSQETFMHRVDEAFGARDRHQLDGLFTDLPRQDRPRGRAALRAVRDAVRDSVVEPLRRPVQSQPPHRSPSHPPPRPLFFPPAEAGISFTIGRDGACDLLIEDTSVSRWHARLDREGDRWLLADTGSTNGTRVNGWRVRQPVVVQPGDHVMFGSAVFVVGAEQHGRGAARPG
ncbi:MAG: FHA domain-containing protein [Actinobacteria bacterium]|nr:FHA domain-containing protein [Actinomycetota bacterium]